MIADHLWQSTLFAAAAAIAALMLRRHGAHIRHAIWMAASLKFLAPFALLMSLGSLVPGPATAAAPSAESRDLSIAVDRFAQPFTSDMFGAAPESPASTAPALFPIAIAIWIGGSVVILGLRAREWVRIRRAVHASTPLPLDVPLRVRASPGVMGPGLVGVWRPVLLVPEGIDRRLTPAQLRAVLEHELCHLRRRDTLTSGLHMAVETIFWFHPLVWWIGARMIDERERACDEHVLRVCGEPLTYAESILEVCRLYADPPLASVPGVAGSDLKKRVAAIVLNRVGRDLSAAGRTALTVVAALAIALPLAAGMVTAPLRAADPQAKFEVASVRSCDPNEARPATVPGGRGAAPWFPRASPGYLYWNCATLAQLIEQAYADRDHPLLNTARPRRDSPQPKRVRGGPSWIESDGYTIEARGSVEMTRTALGANASRTVTSMPPEISSALRALLEERFALEVRRVTETRQMYALTVSKDGLKPGRIRPMKAGDCGTVDEYFAAEPSARGPLRICGGVFITREGGEEHSGVTMKQLAETLSSRTDYFVLDKTGLDGQFTFTLQNEPGAEGLTPDERAARLIQQIGLRLEQTRGPAEYLQIEKVQKPRVEGGR